MYYTKEKKAVIVDKKPMRRTDRKIVCNPSKLSAKQLFEDFGLYEFQQADLAEDEDYGELVFDDKKGTCKLATKPKDLERCRAEKLEQLENELDAAVELLTKEEKKATLKGEVSKHDEKAVSKKYKEVQKAIEKAGSVKELNGVKILLI